jgi:hypothetical protein
VYLFHSSWQFCRDGAPIQRMKVCGIRFYGKISFRLLSFLKETKVGLWDYHAGCVCVCPSPVSTFEPVDWFVLHMVWTLCHRRLPQHQFYFLQSVMNMIHTQTCELGVRLVQCNLVVYRSWNNVCWSCRRYLQGDRCWKVGPLSVCFVRAWGCIWRSWQTFECDLVWDAIQQVGC